jgi:hypothetical protein
VTNYVDFPSAIKRSIELLKQYGIDTDTGHWQGVSTAGKPDLVTKELIGLQFSVRMPGSKQHAQDTIGPNLPWAEDHFQERVSRVPSNPGEQYKKWPWWSGQEQAFDHDDEFMIFSHTYQERFWPKQAGDRWLFKPVPPGQGIRYPIGDLDDVIGLLRKEPYTRQAYFPIFFPEDTGAIHGGRIPCSLGYHFLLRSDKLHCWYDIRSCDAVRHFRDDLYLAVRLVQWVLSELKKDYEIPVTAMGDDMISPHPTWIEAKPGYLHFAAHSFHVHKGDIHLL